MGVTWDLDGLRAEQIAFGFSPGMETVLSLHILADSRHHPLHIPWVLDARKRMSPWLKAEAKALALFYAGPVQRFWRGGSVATLRTVAEDIAALAEMKPEFFAAEVLEMLFLRRVPAEAFWSGADLQQSALAAAERRIPQSVGYLRAFMTDPAKAQQRLVTFLTAYWEACLAQEWPRVEEQIRAEVESRTQLLAQRGPFALLMDLAEELRVDPVRKVAFFRRPGKTALTLDAGDEILLQPSYFTWPHSWMLPRPPIITYPIHTLREEGRPVLPPEQLLKMLRALGDPVRLQLLELLQVQRRSTRELAALVGLTESAISRHIHLLADAGFIKHERESYFLFHRVDRRRFREMVQALAYFGGRPKSPSPGHTDG